MTPMATVVDSGMLYLVGAVGDSMMGGQFFSTEEDPCKLFY